MGTSLADIRDDHVRRYELALQVGQEMGARSVCDLGAGFGYGSWLLAQHIESVVGYDVDPDVIPFAEHYWYHPRIRRAVLDLTDSQPDPADLYVAFEVLEHFECSGFLRLSTRLCACLVGSVPNEDVIPFGGAKINPEHVRHYRPDEIRHALEDAGWCVERLGSQPGKHGPSAKVSWERTDGRTLVFVARPA